MTESIEASDIPCIVGPPIYRRAPNEILLGQGDILDPAKMQDWMAGHLGYFLDPKFYRYIVLTQTCDLDRRREMADFISIAVVRKMSDVIWRKHFEVGKTAKDAKNKIEALLTALFNHNYNRRGLFYLPKDPDYGLEEDGVADLRVMFSLHRAAYNIMLGARLGAITDIYAAQLGHIAGHMFSRVATPGWDELNPELNFKEYLKSTIKNISAREDQVFHDLREEHGNKCLFPNCDNTAETFRWVVPENSDNRRYDFVKLLLCMDHAKKYDEARSGRDSQGLLARTNKAKGPS